MEVHKMKLRKKWRQGEVRMNQVCIECDKNPFEKNW